uniref:50S ribosomal protein L33, chloroplastic n=1 Tax=Salix viminalis TaxID=40686 RepID=A0A6N2MVU6_SALVM
MGDKKKKTFMFIRLVSAAGTGFFYVKRKSAKKALEKLEFRKYDPRVNRHLNNFLFLLATRDFLTDIGLLGQAFMLDA